MCYYGNIKKKEQRTYSPEGWQQSRDCGHPFCMQRNKAESTWRNPSALFRGGIMLVTCKNKGCIHYWKLSKKEHCLAEESCPGYMSNRREGEKQIPKCKDCEFCKRIYTDQGKEYHWECCYKGRHKTILIVDQRRCDCRL